jgi:hypothetical protein
VIQIIEDAMILRLSQKLNTKIKAGTLPTLPLHENPLADWSAHLFVADRTQYILLSNTKALYSTVLYAKGITNDGVFIDSALTSLREFMASDGLESAYRRFVVSASGSVRFATALDRSVTGSMNDLVNHATAWLADSVWYDILAFSRPNHVLTRLGYPIVRRLQKRFGRDSAASMFRAVRSGA